MALSLSHRGPDDQGVWVDAGSGVALGHRRLSIVDLSQAGHQPMVSADQSSVICYNGEVYNFADVRKELPSVAFRGGSDTEVILEAAAAWGISRAIPRFNGMFALALWDLRAKTLSLVRDRLGIKPVYWGQFGDLFIFGSELKALRAHPGWTPRIRSDAVAAFMRHGYIPGPHTIYEGVWKLEPGSILTLPAGRRAEPHIERYWDLRSVVRERDQERRGGAHLEMIDELDSLVRDAVGRRMVADVPLGAFLSGGVDSSTVAALMQAQSSRPIRTYCIGFEQDAFDEAPHASAVARHLGTDHTELYATAKDALQVVPELPEWYDEPFSDSSQIPTLLVSRLTRQHVTVALSGDGGDELFAGYDRYLWNRQLCRWMKRVPAPVRRASGLALDFLSPYLREDWFARAGIRVKGRVTRARLAKLSGVLSDQHPESIYRQILSLWPNPTELVLAGAEAKGRLWDPPGEVDLEPEIERPQYLDLLTYLPDDILTKVDRASMAVALEARVPLIDYRVVEFAWRLPVDMKIREGRGKWILRKILERYVPNTLIERPKKGFGVPLADWLRGELREWAEDLLRESTLAQQGLLNTALVRKTWQDHLAGNQSKEQHLWAVLMLQAWARRWA